jgi:hypothetical protein
VRLARCLVAPVLLLAISHGVRSMRRAIGLSALPPGAVAESLVGEEEVVARRVETHRSGGIETRSRNGWWRLAVFRVFSSDLA